MSRERRFDLLKPNVNYTYATTCCGIKEPYSLPEQSICNLATDPTTYWLYP